MQQPVPDGREDDSGHADEQQAAEQRVAAREKFPRWSFQRSERPHAGENHRRIGKRVEPRKMFEKMVTRHSKAKRRYQQATTDQETDTHAPVKCITRQQRMGARLEHGEILFRSHNYSSATAGSGARAGL